MANVVALGAITELSGFVSRRALDRALSARVPAGTEELNRKAVSLGMKLARDYIRGRHPSADPEPATEDL